MSATQSCFESKMWNHILAFGALQNVQNLLEIFVLVVLQQFEREHFKGGYDASRVSNSGECRCSIQSSCAGEAVNWEKYVVV